MMSIFILCLCSCRLDKTKSASSRKYNRVGNQEGFVLVTTMMILIVLALLGIASLNTATFETMIAGNEKWLTEQFYQADSGISELLARNFKPNDPGNLPSPTPSPSNPITCSNLQGHPPFQTYDPNGDGNNVQLYYIKNVEKVPFIAEVLSCATKGNTIASITAGIQFGLPPGGLSSPTPGGFNP